MVKMVEKNQDGSCKLTPRDLDIWTESPDRWRLPTRSMRTTDAGLINCLICKNKQTNKQARKRTKKCLPLPLNTTLNLPRMYAGIIRGLWKVNISRWIGKNTKFRVPLNRKWVYQVFPLSITWLVLNAIWTFKLSTVVYTQRNPQNPLVLAQIKKKEELAPREGRRNFLGFFTVSFFFIFSHPRQQAMPC